LGIQRHIAFFQSLDSAEIYLFGWAWFYMLKLAIAHKLHGESRIQDNPIAEGRERAGLIVGRNVYLAVSRASRYHLINVSPEFVWQTKAALQKKISREPLNKSG